VILIIRGKNGSIKTKEIPKKLNNQSVMQLIVVVIEKAVLFKQG